MGLVGSFPVVHGSTAGALAVYPDGLVIVSPRSKKRWAYAFGAIGAAIANSSAQKAVGQRLEVLKSLGADAGATEAANAIESRALLASDITSASITKGLGKARKLAVERGQGKPLHMAFPSNKTPVAEVVALLQPLLGDRLHVEVSD